MFKFFVSPSQIQNSEVNIIGEDVNHISNVLRLHVTDKIIVCDKINSKSYIAEIIELSKKTITCKITDDITKTTEPSVKIDLYQGIPKLDKMEFIIQKAIEIGVNDIYPVAFERCIVKLDKGAEEKKLDRWRKISEAASKQSKRDIIPNIGNVQNLENICHNINKYDMILLAYENEENNTLKQELKKLEKRNNLKIGVIVGPEGGLSGNEVDKMVEMGAKCVSLGKRILRTETASIVMLADIIYELELWYLALLFLLHTVFWEMFDNN